MGMKAAEAEALKADWSCVGAAPMSNKAIPGMRYGASMPTRPQMVMLPCPCAGGDWTKPTQVGDATLDNDGLWTARRGLTPNVQVGAEKGFGFVPPAPVGSQFWRRPPDS